MKHFTSDRLVQQVTAKASLAAGDFEDQEILNFAYDCLITDLVPLLITLREEYFVKTTTHAITQGQSEYAIPYNASGMTLRDIKILKGDQVTSPFQMPREDVTSTVQGSPKAFYKEENNIVLYPTPDRTEGTLKLAYFTRPSALVPVSECGLISAIDTNTNIITGSFPATWTTADTFDLVNGRSGYESKAMDLTAYSVTTSSIALASIPDNLQVGDYICLVGESCFPQIPQEAHQLLVHMTMASVLEGKGDRDGLAIAQGKIDRMTSTLRLLMQDRIEGRPERFRSQLL